MADNETEAMEAMGQSQQTQGKTWSLFPPFEKFPIELRMIIIEETLKQSLLTSNPIVDAHLPKSRVGRALNLTPSILLVSKAFYERGIKMLMGANKFRFTTKFVDLADPMFYMQHISIFFEGNTMTKRNDQWIKRASLMKNIQVLDSNDPTLNTEPKIGTTVAAACFVRLLSRARDVSLDRLIVTINEADDLLITYFFKNVATATTSDARFNEMLVKTLIVHGTASPEEDSQKEHSTGVAECFQRWLSLSQIAVEEFSWDPKPAKSSADPKDKDEATDSQSESFKKESSGMVTGNKSTEKKSEGT